MDYVQALFSFFIAPLFGTVILGMLWKRATDKGGFWGLLSGTGSSILMWMWVNMNWAIWRPIGLQWDAEHHINRAALRIIAVSDSAQPMAENMFRALWSWIICVIVTVVVSLLTKPRTDTELTGLVMGCTDIPSEGKVPIYERPVFWACVVAVVFVVLNIYFW
jgi:SSS family solute:Na+ symporter